MMVERPLLLIDANFEYTKTRKGYILKSFDGSEETLEESYKIVEKLPETYRLFPQGSILKNGLFRRCDCVWIKFEDRATNALIAIMCTIAARRGYVDTVWDFVMLTRETINLDLDSAVFAIAQAVSCGALGEYTAYEMGYIPQKKELSYKERSIYCENLALWELDTETKVPHMAVSHQFRKIRSEDGEEMTVAELVERRCAEKKAQIYPQILEIYYQLACEIEAGMYEFVNAPPRWLND